MDWTSYITGIVTTPVLVALAAWLGKVWAGRILEKDRATYQTQMESLLSDLRTRSTKELLVHQLQFQKEFEVYKELWKTALALARAGSKLRALQFGPPASPDEIRRSVEDSYRHLRDTVYDNRPFYAPEICETAKAMLNDLGDVVSKRQHLEQLGRGKISDNHIETACKLGGEIEQKLDEINSRLDSPCTAIRGRIWNTTASGWDRLGEQ